jgi:hypothetical protein
MFILFKFLVLPRPKNGPIITITKKRALLRSFESFIRNKPPPEEGDKLGKNTRDTAIGI